MLQETRHNLKYPNDLFIQSQFTVNTTLSLPELDKTSSYLAEWFVNSLIFPTSQQSIIIDMESFNDSPFLPVDIYLHSLQDKITSEEMEFLIETLRKETLSVFGLSSNTNVN